MYRYHFLLMSCCYNISIKHHLRDITTFPVYLTTCDLEKSFTLTVKWITIQVHFPIYV